MGIRRRKHTPETFAVAFAAAVIAVCGMMKLHLKDRSVDYIFPERLRCAIEFKAHDDTTRGLLTGYNYFLLEKYAADNGIPADIIVARKGEFFRDSLLAGSIDILAIPYADSIGRDSLLCTAPIDSFSLWMVREGEKSHIQILNSWIEDYHASPQIDSTREIFLRTYNPVLRAATGGKISYAGPYDSIIRDCADSLGWDWRLLAAVIFQESRFRIDVISPRGAMGLMQMMPHTAGRMETEDPFNPRMSISSGARYLKLLSQRYRKIAADSKEQEKLTLAAYNAGEGRIRDLLNYAALKGIHSGRWEDIISVIPEMNDSTLMSITDTVKLGVFKGEETIRYVEMVEKIYDAYREVCPE